jgi:hypothetical protein
MMNAEVIAAIVACLMGIAGLCGAVAAWFKAKTETEQIRRERLSTKSERDGDSQAMHDAILKLQFEVTSLKDTSTLHSDRIDDLNKQSSTLNTALAQVLTKLDTIFDTIKEMKEQK